VLGRTGADVSVVTFPGLALKHHAQAESTAGLRRAIERGVNYFDVAPAYGQDGECEIKMGEGLKGVDRDSYFLSCKSKCDDAKGTREELERSLKRLKTDHFNLYQLHCLQKKEEVEQALGPGGALETIVKARDEGKVKHIGFSAHTTVAALTALDGYKFDTCMFPINFVEWFRNGFGKEVVEKAGEKGTAIIAIKPVSLGRWPKGVKKTYQWWYRPIEDPDVMRRAMRWTLSIPGVVTGIPVSYLDVLDKTIDGVRGLQPVTPAETRELEKLAANCTPLFRDDKRDMGLLTPHDRCVG
jgi:predicted aldo/keto reductase-like oxidoreductase